MGYGRKIVVIRVAFVVSFFYRGGSLFPDSSGVALEPGGQMRSSSIGNHSVAAARVISLVLVNALAVNSITGERDGRAPVSARNRPQSQSSFLAN